MKTANCHEHNDIKTDKQCSQCFKPICKECINKYWHVNKISSMFSAQQEKAEELMVCASCLRKIKVKNTFVSSLLLILVIGLIASMIIAII